MSIRIKVPLKKLRNADVAKALSDLMVALSGVAPEVRAPARRKAAAAEVVKVEAPAPRSASRRRSRKKAPEKKPAASPSSDASAATEKRYQTFLNALPARSREFLNLVEQRGTVTMSEAMSELSVTAPKALGGITGSIGRWAPTRGVPVPYVADKTSSGERMWRWVRDEPTGNEGKWTKAKARGKKPRRSGKTKASKSKRRSSGGRRAASKESSPKEPVRGVRRRRNGNVTIVDA
jgi:hypothetical protein